MMSMIRNLLMLMWMNGLSVCCCCKSVCLGKISDVAWEKMHFTWFSRRYGFSLTRHQILPSPLRGSGQDTVSSWEKTPSLLENHVKCISDTYSGMRADSSFRKVDGPVCLRSGRVFVCFQDECGGPDVRAGRF